MGEPVEFWIQARNDNGENRISGNDDFEVKIMTVATDDEPAAEIACEITDKDDGSYSVVYQVEKPCEVNVKVKFRDEKGDMVNVRG
jgi:hypothetical protein